MKFLSHNLEIYTFNCTVHGYHHHIVPQSTLRTIYYAYIHSILSYGIIIWGRSSNVNTLFILQKKIIKS